MRAIWKQTFGARPEKPRVAASMFFNSNEDFTTAGSKKRLLLACFIDVEMLRIVMLALELCGLVDPTFRTESFTLSVHLLTSLAFTFLCYLLRLPSPGLWALSLRREPGTYAHGIFERLSIGMRTEAAARETWGTGILAFVIWLMSSRSFSQLDRAIPEMPLFGEMVPWQTFAWFWGALQILSVVSGLLLFRIKRSGWFLAIATQSILALHTFKSFGFLEQSIRLSLIGASKERGRIPDMGFVYTAGEYLPPITLFVTVALIVSLLVTARRYLRH